MKSLHIVLLLVFGLTIAQVHDNRALWELRDMIICANPDSWPILDYSDYGCYCGFGGYGTPVDDLDRCCQVHDYCYKAAKMLPNCNPYLKSYSYICDKANKTVTCQSNSECGMFVCECDKTIAECFAMNTYNKEHNHLPNEYCN